MRFALASLIALGFATTAFAQDPASPAPAPAAPAAAPAATPAAPGAAPTTSASPPAAAAPVAPPQRPTTGDGAQLLDVIDRVCVPLVKGGDIDQLSKAAGFKKTRNGYVATLGAKPYQVVLAPQGSNKKVCNLTINYAIGQEKPIVSALNVWAFLHQPELKLQRSDIIDGPDGIKRTTTSWEHFTDTTSIGLVFVQERNIDNSPMDKRSDRATLLYSER
jgi:hypothetical protein